MEIDLYQVLQENLILLIFCVTGFGYVIARIKIGKSELGSTIGVLLAGLLFGHFGLEFSPLVGNFGFVLFIFAVGLQAGPSFFGVVLKDGAKYVAMAAAVAGTAIALVLALDVFLNLDYGFTAGLLAGALTSTPTLAGAQDAVNSGLASLPDGFAASQALTNVSLAYAMTYFFGTMGLLLLARYLPTALRINLPAEAKKLEHAGKPLTRSDAGEGLPVIRAYRVPLGDIPGKTIEQAVMDRGKRLLLLKVRRGSKILEATPDLVLEEGDVVSVIATLGDHMRRGEPLKEEVLDPELLNYQITTKEIVVINENMIGKSLREGEFVSRYGCFVRGIQRASIDLPATDNVVIHRGDRLVVTGEEQRLDQLARDIGRVESEITQTDLLTLSFGIGGGLLLGMVVVNVGWLSVGLGAAGGLLLVGVSIGFLRSLHPTFGGVPRAARWILMEFGLALFMASVGVNAGGEIVAALQSIGAKLVFAGLVVTVVPAIVGYYFGTHVLKLNPALALGSVMGAMTSTPSLNAVVTASKSEVPALGYAGTYTFANVFLTFAGSIMMTF